MHTDDDIALEADFAGGDALDLSAQDRARFKEADHIVEGDTRLIA